METAPSVPQLRAYITVFSATLRPSLDTENNKNKTAKYKHRIINVLLNLILHMKHMAAYPTLPAMQSVRRTEVKEL